MRKILIISHQSNKSGAPRFLLNVFSEINRDPDFELQFVLNQYQESANEFINKFNTKYFILDRFKITRYFKYRFKVYNYLKTLWFQKIVKKFNPDLIYINTVGLNPFSKYVFENNFKYILHVHETGSSLIKNRNAEYMQNLIKKAYLIIGCAKNVSQFIISNYKVHKVKTIYEAIDINRFNHILPVSFSESNGISKSKQIIGVTGAPQYRKGTDIFIKAAISFNQRNRQNNFFFIWLGGTTKSNNNKFYNYCLSLIKESGFKNILLKNQLDNVENFYRALDLFVIPSREDPFPLSMLEAMYFKVPVIGSRVSGIPEALADNCGELFESEDVENLSILFEKFTKNKAAFTKNSENAYNKFINNFTVEAIYPELMKILIT